MASREEKAQEKLRNEAKLLQAEVTAASVAAKQYSTALQTVLPLTLDSEYYKFRDQLELYAFSAEWHESILDKSVPPPSTPSFKDKLDLKYAYMVLMTKTESHEVYQILMACPRGDARQAITMCHEYFHRDSASGRAEATVAFHGATMDNTGTTIVGWCALVSRNAKTLAQVGLPRPDGEQLTRLLEGLLPEFDPIKLLIENREDSSMDLAKAKAKLIDNARGKKLMLLAKGGDQRTNAKSFSLYESERGSHDSRGNGKGGNGGRGKGNNSAKAPDPLKPAHMESCKNFNRGKCWYRECKHWHDGQPQGKRPDSVVNVHHTTPAPATQPAGQPAYTFLVNSTPGHAQAYEPADYEEQEPGAAPKSRAAVRLLQLMTFLLVLCTGFFSLLLEVLALTVHKLRRASPGSTLGLLVALAGVALFSAQVYAQQDGDLTDAPTIRNAKVFLTSRAAMANHPVGYGWCSDSGTNRFVTNDALDFLPGSVIDVNITVAVGGGTTSATKQGTVLVRSLDYHHHVKCENVLYIPTCPMKLMPASTFIAKDCTLTYHDLDKVSLVHNDGTPLFNGKEINGLFFFHAETIRATDPTPQVSPASTFFGLKAGKISASAKEFPQQLYEAHCAYGHLHFDKVRKLLGLKKGHNPDCESCAIAKSKQQSLDWQNYTRSTRAGHRIHIDVGFTRNSNFCFQLYIDDATREGALDVLVDKSHVLAEWTAYKDHIEADNFPAKIAFVRSDSEPLYQTAAWAAKNKADGVVHEFSPRYRHDGSGVVERAMGVVGISYRCMMIHGSAPEADTPDCLRFANVIRNYSPTTANGGWSPREAKAGMRLALNQKLMRGPMFCLVFAHVYEAERDRCGSRQG